MAEQNVEKGDQGESVHTVNLRVPFRILESSIAPRAGCFYPAALQLGANEHLDPDLAISSFLRSSIHSGGGESLIEASNTVSWQWGSGAPSGTVAEVAKEGEVAIESHRGNTIKKNAEPDNPAVHVERSGNDVVKKASELEVEEKADGNTGGDKKDDAPATGESADQDEELKSKEEDAKAGAEKDKDNEMKDANGEDKAAGDKRSKEEQENGENAGEDDANGEDKEEETEQPAAKKQKINDANDKKKAGRPKKSNAPPKQKKVPKKAATESGEPRRSGRNRS